ncbi:hypothetical protein [Halobacillus massiliensis]|uniref:hypothetical protein n=1 Tax=Halobacillus massiliensis TaxID=1926286 RepID=UPI0009E25532|nr:hypothetical protein [Halobacillus massiliensis]
MRLLKKHKGMATIIFIAVVFLAMNFTFPFSVVSVEKSFSHTPDPVFLKEYKQEVDQTETYLSSIEEKDEILTLLSNITAQLKHPYFTQEKPTVKIEEIKQLKKDWADLSEQLNSLQGTQHSYDEDYMENLSEMVELQIENLKEIEKDGTMKFNTRSDLENLFDHVHKTAWSSNLMVQSICREIE